MSPRILGWSAAAALLLTPLGSVAQTSGPDLRGFSPAPTPQASLALEPSATLGAQVWSVGLWAAQDFQAVRLSSTPSLHRPALVRHRTMLDAYLAVGLGERLDAAIVLPTIPFQKSDDELPEGVDAPPANGWADARLRGKLNLVPTSDLGGFGFSLLGDFTLPTGDADALASSQGPTMALQGLAELRLVALALRARAGGRLRTVQQQWAGRPYGNELPFAAGLALRPQALGLDDAGRWTWSFDVQGVLPLQRESGPDRSSLLGSISALCALGDFNLTGAIEAPFMAAPGTPDVRGVLSLSFTPTAKDQDGDGVGDEDDLCPELEEDPDGIDDEDGCPEFDEEDGFAREHPAERSRDACRVEPTHA